MKNGLVYQRVLFVRSPKSLSAKTRPAARLEISEMNHPFRTVDFLSLSQITAALYIRATSWDAIYRASWLVSGLAGLRFRRRFWMLS